MLTPNITVCCCPGLARFTPDPVIITLADPRQHVIKPATSGAEAPLLEFSCPLSSSRSMKTKKRQKRLHQSSSDQPSTDNNSLNVRSSLILGVSFERRDLCVLYSPPPFSSDAQK